MKNTFVVIEPPKELESGEQSQPMVSIRANSDHESLVTKEPAKKVKTYDLKKKENGFLVELFKDGDKTISYLSSCKPGALKGYHLHKVREANYVCIKGKIKIILYTEKGREEHILSAAKPERLHIPNNVPTGLSNEWKEEAWIINLPQPAYDPGLKDEQVDYTEEECENGKYKK